MGIMASQTASPIPTLHLLLISPTAVTAFNEAKKKYLDPLNLGSSVLNTHIHEASLSQLEESVKFDLIVSPANVSLTKPLERAQESANAFIQSYGILDGGFDDAISRAFSPRNDYFALTRHVQTKLHKEWKGFAPPGTCTLVPLPCEWTDSSREPEAQSKNLWNTKHLALLPTMRVPNNVNWDREVVYECIWSLLNAVYNHNASTSTSEDDRITSLLMSPLATGAGYVPEERWAGQLCLAIKHFVAAVNAPEKKQEKERVTWPRAYQPTYEVQPTWRKEGKQNDY